MSNAAVDSRYPVSSTPEFKARIRETLASTGLILEQEGELLCCEHKAFGNTYNKSYFMAAEDVLQGPGGPVNSNFSRCREGWEEILEGNKRDVPAMSLFIVGEDDYVYSRSGRIVAASLERNIECLRKSVVSWDWLTNMLANPFTRLSAGQQSEKKPTFQAYDEAYKMSREPGPRLGPNHIEANVTYRAQELLKNTRLFAGIANAERRRCIASVYTRIMGSGDRVAWSGIDVGFRNAGNSYVTPLFAAGAGSIAALEFAISLTEATTYCRPHGTCVHLFASFGKFDKMRRLAAIFALREFVAATGMNLVMPVPQSEVRESLDYFMGVMLK